MTSLVSCSSAINFSVYLTHHGGDGNTKALLMFLNVSNIKKKNVTQAQCFGKECNISKVLTGY